MSRKKNGAVPAMIAAAALLLSACAGRIPDSTSADWGLYLKGTGTSATVVDGRGRYVPGYSLDRKGNLTEGGRTVIIGADRLERFRPVESIAAEDATVFSAVLEPGKASGSSGAGPFAVTLRVEPADATDTGIVISSGDPSKVSLSCAGNGTEDPETGELVCAAENGAVTFEFTCLAEGSTAVRCASDDGNCSIEYIVSAAAAPSAEEQKDIPAGDGAPAGSADGGSAVTAQPGVIAAEEDDIPTTENTPGRVRGTKANLRERTGSSSRVLATLPGGKEITILGSADGWTKVIADGVTGYVKSVYAEAAEPEPAASPEPTPGAAGMSVSTSSAAQQSGSTSGGTYTNTRSASSDTAAAPNDGYDHGLAFSSPAASAGDAKHAHEYRQSGTTAPDGTGQVYTVFRCSCGAYYRTEHTGADASGHVHTYTDTVIGATCTESGYTEHRCSCGDAYRDSHTAPAGHRVVTEHDPETGGEAYVCTVCGMRYPGPGGR